MAGSIEGQYLEARTCDVWTGPCFANAEMNWGGKHAVLAWRIERGSFDNVCLNGLSVAAVISAHDTLGLKQTGSSKAILIVDEKATEAQRAALIRLAKHEAGELLDKVVKVESAKMELDVGHCPEGGCGRLRAGQAIVETRCLDHHDKVCGNETAFYPPLSKNVKASAAVAVEHSFSGKGLNETWKETGRRGAYVGLFQIN
jgi:hypothetical protein